MWRRISAESVTTSPPRRRVGSWPPTSSSSHCGLLSRVAGLKENGADFRASAMAQAAAKGQSPGRWPSAEALHHSSAAPSAVDVPELRKCIQMLCGATAPLGKCMDYVHEDITTMGKEFDQWAAMYRKHADQLEEEERLTEEALEPLNKKLLEAQEKIDLKKTQISTIKASVAKNDQRIEELMMMVLGN